MTNLDPFADPDEAGGSERWFEREFLIVAIVAALYAIMAWKGDMDPETKTFMEELLLVSVGGFGVARGLAKMGTGSAGGVQ